MTLVGHLGSRSCDTIKPWHFLRRCAYSSTRPEKLNFTSELPRSADARLDTRQCRIKRPRTRAKTPGLLRRGVLRGGAVSLETSNVGRRAWVCEMIHEKASCSSTGKRNNAVGGHLWLEKTSGFRRRGEARKEGRRELHFFPLATCQLLVSIDALGAEAPRRIAGLRYEILAEPKWSRSFAARLDLYAQRSMEQLGIVDEMSKSNAPLR